MSAQQHSHHTSSTPRTTVVRTSDYRKCISERFPCPPPSTSPKISPPTLLHPPGLEAIARSVDRKSPAPPTLTSLSPKLSAPNFSSLAPSPTPSCPSYLSPPNSQPPSRSLSPTCTPRTPTTPHRLKHTASTDEEIEAASQNVLRSLFENIPIEFPPGGAFEFLQTSPATFRTLTRQIRQAISHNSTDTTNSTESTDITSTSYHDNPSPRPLIPTTRPRSFTAMSSLFLLLDAVQEFSEVCADAGVERRWRIAGSDMANDVRRLHVLSTVVVVYHWLLSSGWGVV
jgi:hypothetical protein